MIHFILNIEITSSAEEPAVPAVIVKKKTVGLDDFIMLGTLGKVKTFFQMIGSFRQGFQGEEEGQQ